MSIHQREPEQPVQTTAVTPDEDPTNSLPLRELLDQRKHARLPKRRWRVIEWGGMVLALLLIIGIVLGVSFLLKGQSTTQSTLAPIPQVNPPAHATYRSSSTRQPARPRLRNMCWSRANSTRLNWLMAHTLLTRRS